MKGKIFYTLESMEKYDEIDYLEIYLLKIIWI